MTGLPRLMVAPNGARAGHADHPALPVTIPEIVACAVACRASGADGLHAHVRDAAGAHVLDAGLYRELLAEMAAALPGFFVQVTTEAAGRFGPEVQRRLVADLRPPAVSIALREVASDGDRAAVARLFGLCAEAGIGVQHLLYDIDDIAALAGALADGTVPAGPLTALIVLGKYRPGHRSQPADLIAPVAALTRQLPGTDWAACAFGPLETACLMMAERLGGKVRIGFENNFLNADGTVATDNAERVRDFLRARAAQDILSPAGRG